MILTGDNLADRVDDLARGNGLHLRVENAEGRKARVKSHSFHAEIDVPGVNAIRDMVIKTVKKQGELVVYLTNSVGELIEEYTGWDSDRLQSMFAEPNGWTEVAHKVRDTLRKDINEINA